MVLLSAGDYGGADAIMVMGGGGKLVVLVVMGGGGGRWVFLFSLGGIGRQWDCDVDRVTLVVMVMV